MDRAGLKKKTHRELLAIANSCGVRLRNGRSKPELIRAIVGTFVRRPPRELSAREETELPFTYGQTRLILMEVGPTRVHAYWEVTGEDRQAATERLGASGSATWVLRFYDITPIEFDGTKAKGCMDVPIDLAPGNWYVDLWAGEKTCFSELGPCTSDGRFEPACRSNIVQMPRPEPAFRYEPQWLKVEGIFEKVTKVREPLPAPSPPARTRGMLGSSFSTAENTTKAGSSSVFKGLHVETSVPGGGAPSHVRSSADPRPANEGTRQHHHELLVIASPAPEAGRVPSATPLRFEEDGGSGAGSSGSLYRRKADVPGTRS